MNSTKTVEKSYQSVPADENNVIPTDHYRNKKLKKQRRQDIQKFFNESANIKQKYNITSNSSEEKSKKRNNKINEKKKTKKNENCCKFTFIFDPNGRLSYWMNFTVSLAFLYNFWVIIYRYTFNEINSNNKAFWFFFDYLADFLYICDIAFNFRTGFLEEGVLQTDPLRLRHHYMNTTQFYVDFLCLLPLDILYLSIGYNSILRCLRLVKIYKFWTLLDRTERHTNYPNIFRSVVMLHYLFAIFHWNASFCYLAASHLNQDSTSITNIVVNSRDEIQPKTTTTVLPSKIPSNFLNMFTDGFSFKVKDKINDVDVAKNYLKAFYWSIMILTLIGDLPKPSTKPEYIFICTEYIFALLLFAAIMGQVGYIVANLGNARKDFQSKLDAVKTYMSIRRVPKILQDRVIRWFDFLWMNHKSTDDNQILNLLPYKLRAEIAIHVHLDTLKRVEIFQNTEAGFLNELVLRLKPVLYSPGDFICRKGEVGKEMYIVNRGKLHVISENGKSVLATLKAGSYFGEISILNMGTSGNRRTANVKSVGYSDLFCLSKEDLWEVLREYPAVRVKLEAIAVKRLEKHKKSLYEIVNLERCKSAPGLIESSTLSKKEKSFKVALKRHSTEPSSNITKFNEYSPYHKRLSLKSRCEESKEIIIPILTVENASKLDNETDLNQVQEIEFLRERLNFLEIENKKLLKQNSNSNFVVEMPIHREYNDNVFDNDEYSV